MTLPTIFIRIHYINVCIGNGSVSKKYLITEIELKWIFATFSITFLFYTLSNLNFSV